MWIVVHNGLSCQFSSLLKNKDFVSGTSVSKCPGLHFVHSVFDKPESVVVGTYNLPILPTHNMDNIYYMTKAFSYITE